MLRIASKNQTRQRVHDRIRKKVMGTPERPRLNVYRSLNHIYVQLIDDLKGVTLVAASTADDRKNKDARVTGGNVASAKMVGKKIAELAKQKGIAKVVFDRGGYIYHGRVKAVADAAREAGEHSSANDQRLTTNDKDRNEISECQELLRNSMQLRSS
jgi:large subunit ribosomal protein L18